MSKTSSVYTRVEPELKEQVEQVLSRLGIPMANAINLFLNQVVLHNGIPFDVKIPGRVPPDKPEISRKKVGIEKKLGYDSLEAEKTVPTKKAKEKTQRHYDI